jgi:hypothetical protein
LIQKNYAAHFLIMNSIKAVFVAVNAYLYFHGKVFVEGAVANSSISQSQPKGNKKRHDGPIRQQSRSQSKRRKIGCFADVAASASSGNDTFFRRYRRRRKVSRKGTVVGGEDVPMKVEEDVSDQEMSDSSDQEVSEAQSQIKPKPDGGVQDGLESAINLSNPFSFLPNELRQRSLDFLNPTDLARAWLVEKSFRNLEMVRYFRKRFSMPELLTEFFQLADKHGRQQMARFFAEFFLDYKSGDVRFQYDAFAQRVDSDFIGQNIRIIRSIREAAIDFLRHGRSATIDPNHMQKAARIESMSDDDLTEFVTHLRTWFPPGDALVRTDTPFASVTAYQYLQFLFDSMHSANDIPLRMTIENVQQCADSRHLLLKLVQPKGVLLNDNGTFADISGKNGVFCGVEWVRTEDDDDEVQLQGTFIVPIGQAHGGIRDRNGNVVDSHALTKLLRAIVNPDSPLDVDFPHECRMLTVDLVRGGIRRRPDRGTKIAEAFLRASDHRRAIMGIVGAFDRSIARPRVSRLKDRISTLKLESFNSKRDFDSIKSEIKQAMLREGIVTKVYDHLQAEVEFE